MDQLLKPLRTTSLKQEVVSYFENLILSGKLEPGHRLPPERELAEKLEVSRPIIHEGLVELAAAGLVSISPRRGTFINDYLHDGNLGVVNSLLDHQSADDLDPGILINLLDFRLNVETAAAAKAAENRTEEHLARYGAILEEERNLSGLGECRIADIDFRFHHLTAIASGNVIYPLLMNGLKDIYMTILTRFYESRESIPAIRELHIRFVGVIKEKNAGEARRIMEEILEYGAGELLRLVDTRRGG
jgi:GntR family transcriptional regulator, transcriptional repressor for pyruvate dehydrogenase complex